MNWDDDDDGTRERFKGVMQKTCVSCYDASVV